MARHKDSWTKKYMENAAVFADAFNFLIYDGRPMIDPQKLRAMDTTLIGTPHGAEQRGAAVQRHRDVLKYLVAKEDDKAAYLLLGVENQSEVHYSMPVRNMVYDALQYAAQVEQTAKSHRQKRGAEEKATAGEYLSGFYKRDRLVPVITLVVYFGAKSWDGPRSLKEMFTVQDEDILAYAQDYKLHLIEPASLTEEQAQKFRTDMRQVMLYVKYSHDREKLQALVQNDAQFRRMERITAEMLNAVTGTKIQLEQNEEIVDMCKAIEDMRMYERREGISQGLSQGLSQGILQGELKKAKEIALNAHAMGISEEVIAKMTNVSVETVRQWLAEAAS